MNPRPRRIAERSPRSTRPSIAVSTRSAAPRVDKFVYRLVERGRPQPAVARLRGGQALARPRRHRTRGSVLARARRGVGDHERCGEVAVPPGAARPTTPTSSSTTACAARSPALSRRGTPRPRSVPPPCSAAARAGTRPARRWRRPGSTSGCTMRPTCVRRRGVRPAAARRCVHAAVRERVHSSRTGNGEHAGVVAT